MNAFSARDAKLIRSQPDRWMLETMCCELLQDADNLGRAALVGLLNRFEHDIVSGSPIDAGHQIIISGLYRRHVGEFIV